jgi:hypothetical protein
VALFVLFFGPPEGGPDAEVEPDVEEADPEEEGYLNVSNSTVRCLWNRTCGGAGTA